MKSQEEMRITGQKMIAKNIFELTLQGEMPALMTDPGQFVHIKVNSGLDPLLRRPISICDVNQASKEFKMIYRAEGSGTKIMSEKSEGMMLDVLGPLGTGFPVGEAKQGDTALLIGGGIGVPPLYYLSKQLVEKGVNVIHILGFQTEEVVFYEKEFSELGPTYVATADGSYGMKGFVTDVIDQQKISFDVLYACGPTPMLKALEDRYREKKAFLSLEQRMGCGIGACFACVCHLQEDPDGYSYKKVCSDGPVFPIGEVVL